MYLLHCVNNVTEILENSFDFQKLEDITPVFYFSDIGRKNDD